MYIVTATAPNPLSNHPWDFQGGYFPRKIHDRAQAIQLAQEAQRKGGTNISITSTTSNKPVKWE